MTVVFVDPDETKDISYDWTDRLSSGDSVSSSDWSITPSGPALVDQELTGNVATVHVSGCTAGQVYELTNQLTTSNSLIYEEGFTIRCEDK